uniref:Putative ovule protein n=1 Tax=Solanum chacoense TaxID=4108 RepID=A0A0V0HZB6_SOLCH
MFHLPFCYFFAESSGGCKPDHIMYEDTYSTSSILTFSCSSIKLEGSFGMRLPFTSEWTLCDIITINSEWCKSVETALVELYLKSKDSDVANTDNESSGLRGVQ